METQNLVAPKVLTTVPTENAQTTKLTVSLVSADEIDVDYETMPGNQPQTYGNFLAIWQNPNSVPWNTDPLQPIFYIQTNTPSGSAAFTGLNINNNDYIIGYSAGPVLTGGGNVQKYGNVCATAYIPQKSEGGQGAIFTPTISNINIGTTSVSFQFDLPDGILPLSNGAWAGMWRGANPSFYTVAPQFITPISLDFSSGRAAFNNASIGRGLTYTIGLFMSGYKSSGGSTQRALACSASFTN